MKTAGPCSFVVLAVLLLAACTTPSQRRAAVPPTAKIASGTTTVEQTGEALHPATAKAETKKQTVTIPAGSIAWQDAKTGELRYQLGSAVPLATETHSESVTAPGAFEPPAPPTIAEEKAAQADFWSVMGYRAAMCVGIAAAVFGLVKGWDLVMWGGLAVGGAGLFGLFVKSHPALLAIIGLGVALKIAGPWIYHTKIKPLETKPTA